MTKAQIEIENLKLPKQWKHWCADQRLRLHGRKFSHGLRQWFYLKGHGHYWRVNCYGMLQCGDTYEEFDRCALCDIAETTMPATRAEFRAAIGKLLQEKRAATTAAPGL